MGMMGQVAQNKTGSVDANPAKKQKTGPVAGVNTGDPEIEAKLDQWLIAKRSKDFASADMIRDELRAQGNDPDTVRPRGWTASAASGAGAGAGTGKTGDAWTDEQLDKWLLPRDPKTLRQPMRSATSCAPWVLIPILCAHVDIKEVGLPQEVAREARPLPWEARPLP